MTNRNQVLKAVRAAFEREPRINLHKYPVRMDFSDCQICIIATICFRYRIAVSPSRTAITIRMKNASLILPVAKLRAST